MAKIPSLAQPCLLHKNSYVDLGQESMGITLPRQNNNSGIKNLYGSVVVTKKIIMMPFLEREKDSPKSKKRSSFVEGNEVEWNLLSDPLRAFFLARLIPHHYRDLSHFLSVRESSRER